MRYLLTIFILFITFILYTCEKREFIDAAAVETGEIQSANINKVVVEGRIIDVGQGISQYGHCWSKHSDAKINNNKTELGSASGRRSFESHMSGLEPGIMYSYRSYVVSNGEVVYGELRKFYSPSGIPALQTYEVNDIKIDYAIVGGIVTDDGGDPDMIKGFCWSKRIQPNPSLSDNFKYNMVGVGNYSDTLNNLEFDTQYFFRAFAKTSIGINYGDIRSFRTKGVSDFILTSNISQVGLKSATASNNRVIDIGWPIISKGTCWNTTGEPTVQDSKTVFDSGTGAFTSELEGLNPATKYYYRTYAETSNRIYYGKESSFTTLSGQIELITSSVSDVKITTASCGAEIVDTGGDSVLVKGVCWKTNGSGYPNINDNITVDGSGSGSYVSKITGLLPNQYYYIRAYATNSQGTYYGNDQLLKTYNDSIMDIDNNVYYTLKFTNHNNVTQEWMAENLRTLHFYDGEPIWYFNLPTMYWQVLDIPSYRWPNNDTTKIEVYGNLYNWYAVETNKLCPEGWHVPSRSEWQELIDNYGGDNNAGGDLKHPGLNYWAAPNSDASNTSSFAALPAGYVTSEGEIINTGEIGIWWSSTSESEYAWYRSTHFDSNAVTNKPYLKAGGLSVRCIKD